MLEYAAFARLVHEVYPRLHDRVYLQGHPLLAMLGGASPLDVERLHRVFVDALEWLRPLGTTSPSSVEWRRYRHLQLRYVEGVSPEQIARELQISPRQARRDHADALDEIARLLWERLVRAGAGRPSREESAAAATVSIDPSRPSVPRGTDTLEAELSSLAATAPQAPTDVGEVARGVVETVARLAERLAVTVAVGDVVSGESVVTSRTVLRQLLLNLLAEAIVDHAGGSILIEAVRSADGSGVVIGLACVKGDAANPAADLPAIDDVPLLPNDHDQRLEVSRRLARGLGASLEIQVHPRGYAVVLSLVSARARTLLLVDDNPDVSLLFRRYLRDTEYQLVQARSAERALRLARELQPDVVILDVLMPSHDGWEILQALRQDQSTARLPVVICSVIPDHALAYSLGVTDFLAKPVTRPSLLEVLARLRRDPPVADRPDRRESSDTAPPPAGRPAG